MAKPVYALVNGVWTLVGSTTAHTHAIADVTDLQTELNAKATIAHTHTQANITDLPTIPDPTGETDGKVLAVSSGSLAYANAAATVSIPPFAHFGDIVVGAGTSRWYNDTGNAIIITSLRANIGTAATGANVLIDVNVDGTSVLGGSPLTITAASYSSGVVVANFSIPSGSYVTVDVDQVGSTIPGNNLTVYLGA